VLALAFGAIVIRLVSLQVVHPEDYVSEGLAQRLTTVELPAERGSIFDRAGNELAMSVRQHTVWADPRLVSDPVGAAAALAPIVGVDATSLQYRLTRDAHFVYLARQVDDETAAAVTDLELDGVALLDESRRFNPNGELAASVLGRVDPDNTGISGLEIQFEEALRGRPGELLFERAPGGRTIATGEQRLEPAARGNDLVLSLDRSLQFEVERSLLAQVAATGARSGSAVVTDPRTGEILAMASAGAATNEDGEAVEGEAELSADNKALTQVFEPGSVLKVITVAAALEEGLVTPDTVLTVPDHITVAGRRFSDHDPHPTGPWTVTDILTASSNVGAILLAQQLGTERFDSWLRRFGLGEATGLGFPGESSGLMLDVDEWTGATLPSSAIGYGIAVNTMQILDVFNTIANDGVRQPPSLVTATLDDEGRQHPTDRPEAVRVVSPRTAEQMRAMLSNVVSNGTGTRAAIDGYTVGGKTGTARQSARGQYVQGAYTASFAGFVPAEDPRLSAIVVLDRPFPYYGGESAAPVFASIAQYALRHLRIPPPSVADMPDVTTLDPTTAPRD
jgi:cell division protein FtsI (penicillin-binding protein 3)